MKIALTADYPGAVHVRGGRLLRVRQAHAVPTANQNVMDDPRYRAPYKSDMATAQPGDLAMEIVAVDTGELVGLSYLSGGAIQLNVYTRTFGGFIGAERLLELAQPARMRRGADVEDAMMALNGADVDDPDDVATRLSAARAAVWRARGDVDHDVVTCELEVGAQFGSCATWLAREWAEGPRSEARSHFMAMVFYRKKPSSIRRNQVKVANMHLQPPQDGGDWAASPFQLSMVLAAAAAQPAVS